VRRNDAITKKKRIIGIGKVASPKEKQIAIQSKIPVEYRDDDDDDDNNEKE